MLSVWGTARSLLRLECTWDEMAAGQAQKGRLQIPKGIICSAMESGVCLIQTKGTNGF